MADILAVLEAEREIRKVLGRYAECVDTQTLDQIRTADFYTPDGVLLEPGLHGDRAEGVDSIIASHVEKLKAGRPPCLHTRIDYDIDVDIEKGEARVASNFIYVARSPDGLLVGAVGRYNDLLVRGADGGWRIREHRVTPLPQKRELYAAATP